MGYLTVAVILGVLVLFGIMAFALKPSNKRKNKSNNMPDGVSYNEPQGEGGAVEPKPRADGGTERR